MNIHILVLVIAIILFGLLAFKQMSALILAPLVTSFVIICSGMPILDSLKNLFMPAAAEYVTSYFLVFFVGALFGAVYQYTGAAESIARAIASLCHGKFVAPIIMIITGLLTFGGVSGFVVFFVIYPIALNLFKEANLTRRLIPAAISAGCWTWSMSGPGSPSVQNVIAMDSLGTPSTAAFVPSLLTAIIVILVLFNNPWHPFPVETSVFAGVALATILMFKRIDGMTEWINIFNKGAADSGVSILNTAIVVGFGGVVAKTQGFTDLVAGLKHLSMPPLIFVMVTVAVCAGACGSASGGMGVAFKALKDTYLKLGASLPDIHRISTIAAGTLDTLPHQGAQITLLGICKLTHKEAYWDIAVTQIFIPLIDCLVFIALTSIF